MIKSFSSHVAQDITAKECELVAMDLRLVRKSTKDLLPHEYIKQSYGGSSQSFEGIGGATLTWIE